MNPRAILFFASVALFSIATPSFAETRVSSLGTSKAKTAGGSHTLKLSVLTYNSLPAAREIVSNLNSTGIRSLLANGLKVSVPAQLAGEEQIRAWKTDEPHILSARTGAAIAARLPPIIAKAQRLHDKAEITDQELNSVKNLASYVNIFTANSQLLAKYKVAVLLDE